jgi:hypothetical protein
MSPQARRNQLEGGVSPGARRNLLEGAFDWATPVGRGGHRGMVRARCVCSSKRCVLFLFFAGFKQDYPRFFRGPQGCPRHSQRTKCLHRQLTEDYAHLELLEISWNFFKVLPV